MTSMGDALAGLERVPARAYLVAVIFIYRPGRVHGCRGARAWYFVKRARRCLALAG